MKLLVEFTPAGGTLQRISNEDVALDYLWIANIISFSSFRLELEYGWGGYAKPTFSNITISPESFEGNWPPSGDALFKIMLTESDESSSVTIFDGYGTPTSLDRNGVVYELTTPDFSTTISSGSAQSGTVLSLMTSYCSTLGLTLDSTAARSTSPAVSYTPSADIKLIDIMSGMCAAFTHGFKVVESTLYLVDMLATGTAQDVTEFEVLPCSYGKTKPYSLIKSGDISVAGSGSASSSELDTGDAYHVTTALVQAALSNIGDFAEQDTATIDTKIDLTEITVLDDFEVYDESTIEPTTSTVKAVSTLYNFDEWSMEIEGVGVLS